jgi:hypothetical protein
MKKKLLAVLSLFIISSSVFAFEEDALLRRFKIEAQLYKDTKYLEITAETYSKMLFNHLESQPELFQRTEFRKIENWSNETNIDDQKFVDGMYHLDKKFITNVYAITYDLQSNADVNFLSYLTKAQQKYSDQGIVTNPLSYFYDQNSSSSNLTIYLYDRLLPRPQDPKEKKEEFQPAFFPIYTINSNNVFQGYQFTTLIESSVPYKKVASRSTFYTDKNKIRLKMWDHGSEDGDIITVFLDEEEKFSRKTLKQKTKLTLPLNLTQEVTTVRIRADFGGTNYPCTVTAIIPGVAKRFSKNAEDGQFIEIIVIKVDTAELQAISKDAQAL